MDFSSVRHIGGDGVNRDGVTNTQAQVASHDLVHQDLVILGISSSVSQSDAKSLLSLLAYQIRSVD